MLKMKINPTNRQRAGRLERRDNTNSMTIEIAGNCFEHHRLSPSSFFDDSNNNNNLPYSKSIFSFLHRCCFESQKPHITQHHAACEICEDCADIRLRFYSEPRYSHHKEKKFIAKSGFRIFHSFTLHSSALLQLLFFHHDESSYISRCSFACILQYLYLYHTVPTCDSFFKSRTGCYDFFSVDRIQPFRLLSFTGSCVVLPGAPLLGAIERMAQVRLLSYSVLSQVTG